MLNSKLYEADDKMITLIADNYNILESLGRFGINLGFGDKTVREVCEDQNVDTYTFLAIVNFSINGYRNNDDNGRLSVPTLLIYLKASHVFYLDYQIPATRKELIEALDEDNSLAHLILKLYDSYAREIKKHMKYEEVNVFPYVDKLLKGEPEDDYDIETFSRHHGQTTDKLRELKNIIIKYLPSDALCNNKLMAVLTDLYRSEQWLGQHSDVEDYIFIPAIRRLERLRSQSDVNIRISRMISHNTERGEALSEREREVIICVVQGMANKEIADHLCISVNTVITHRRNIARKLQIHSVAGLTIYAIVNDLVDISSVKL